ncbi:MAG: hypothetical protein H7Y33_17595 [Cytophagales bacterium]|nr:hypothetical protein [Rhizobacter sp.]
MTTGASTKKTLYELLGVAPDATADEIKAAHDVAAAASELDPGQRVALKEAASVLSSPRRRALYDSSLRERELPAEIVVLEDDDAPSGYGKKPWLVLGLVILILAGWWVAKRPANKPRTQPPVIAAPAAVVTSEPVLAAATVSPDKLREGMLLGTWHCQGPLIGSGLNLSFVQDGTYSGTSDGQPVRGFYTLAQKALTLNDGRQPNVFNVEELAAQGLVISRGEGKRLACKR